MPNDPNLRNLPPGVPTHAEHEFWNSAPKYSEPPRYSVKPMRPRPSRLRVAMARTLFAVLFSGILALLIYEGSRRYGIDWTDLRGSVARSTTSHEAHAATAATSQ